MRMFRTTISKDEVNELPVLEYEGKRIVVVQDTASAEMACRELVKAPFIGFDTETKPSFTKGVTHKVALIQLATEDVCYLFRVCKFGFPSSLAALLADERICKVGLSLRDDVMSMRRRKPGLQANGLVDLQNEVRKVGIVDMSLQRIYAIIFGKRISKSQRLTNWEDDILTDKQQMYAAIDAWACIDIYKALRNELQENISQER